MKLPFRFQFALAPLVIVVLLTCLVSYTLVELTNIHKENEVTVRREVLTDRIQTAIANTSLLDQLVQELMVSPLEQHDERLFDYLEQTRTLADSLRDLEEIPTDLRRMTGATEKLLREPERVKPKTVHDSLTALLPPLQYQHKIFLAQRRSAFIDYHRHLSVIIPRLSGALLTVLALCIALAVGLTIWGLHTMRRRLKNLTQRAHAVCTGNLSPLPAPVSIRDELDELELCLARMTQRLFDVVAVEKVLQGAENERRRIAMDMHDGVLADLTVLTRKLDCMGHSTVKDEQLCELRSGVDDVIKSLRRTIDDLHPQTLEILGLESALRSFLDVHCNAPGTPSNHFEFDPAIDHALPLFQKINLFRIVTEAVHNLIRHARCDRFEISMRIVTQRLIVTVEDNGVGMPAGAFATGHGCTNITERARTIGSNVLWRPSRFASGTCVELTLPLGAAA